MQKRVDNSHATSLEESFTYDNLNRLTGSTVTGLTPQAIGYSANGNIASKTDAGTYSYLASKPNAVSAVTNPSSAIPALQQLVSYTAFMQPAVLTENNYELTYTYGADYERIKGVLKQNTTLMRTRYYTGPGYEKDISSNSTKELHYIDSPAGLMAIVVKEGGSYTYHYVHADHLGSILTVTTSSGVVEFEQNFDAWGRRRNTTTWAYTGVTAPPDWLYRGYTGHEHLAEFNLINLNGRLYDPVVGRVLSPDNFVQDPFSTQGFNRYSYGFNNPLKYSDPDGNFLFIPFLIGVGIGALSGYLTGKARGAEGWGLVAYTLGGAAIGGVASLAGGAVGGYIGQNLSFAGAGTVSGAAGGLVAGTIGGGGFAALGGGNILDGIWKGAVSGLVGGAVGAYIGGGGGAFVGGAAAGATGSALNGGDVEDILGTALLSGAISWGAYQLQQGAAYRNYEKAGGVFTRRQFQKISVATQRSFARGKEFGGWILDNGDVEMWPRVDNKTMNPTAKPNGTIGMFHSHPNWGVEKISGLSWFEPHSDDDITFNNLGGVNNPVPPRVNSYVFGRQNVYIQTPGGTNGMLWYKNTNYFFNAYPFNLFSILRLNR